MKNENSAEVAALLRERADLMEVFGAGCFEIKIDVKFRHTANGIDRHIEHYISRNDGLFDHDSHEMIWELLRRRITLIDERLSELGLTISFSGDTGRQPSEVE